MNSVGFRCSWWFSVIVAFATAGLAAERDISRTFAVEPGCAVTVDSHRGSILVDESDGAEVRVTVHLEVGAENEAEAEKLLRELQLEMSGDARSVRVVARNPRESRARFVWQEKKQIEPTFRLSVPRSCNLDLATLTGAITVGNVAGRHRARVEEGNIFFRRIDGAVDATTQFGDIVVSRCSGPVSARVMRGIIRLGTIGGPCDLRNESGAVEVLAAKAGGGVYAEAGDATIGLPSAFEGEMKIATSGGNIVVQLDPAADCEIDASAKPFGRVHWKMPLAIQVREARRTLVTRLNRGGPHVVLRAGGGDITIVPNDAWLE